MPDRTRGNAIYGMQASVFGKIVSLQTDLSLLIIMATIVFSMMKITSGLKIFREPDPRFLLEVEGVLLESEHHRVYAFW